MLEQLKEKFRRLTPEEKQQAAIKRSMDRLVYDKKKIKYLLGGAALIILASILYGLSYAVPALLPFQLLLLSLDPLPLIGIVVAFIALPLFIFLIKEKGEAKNFKSLGKVLLAAVVAGLVSVGAKFFMQYILGPPLLTWAAGFSMGGVASAGFLIPLLSAVIPAAVTFTPAILFTTPVIMAFAIGFCSTLFFKSIFNYFATGKTSGFAAFLAKAGALANTERVLALVVVLMGLAAMFPTIVTSLPLGLGAGLLPILASLAPAAPFLLIVAVPFLLFAPIALGINSIKSSNKSPAQELEMTSLKSNRAMGRDPQAFDNSTSLSPLPSSKAETWSPSDPLSLKP